MRSPGGCSHSLSEHLREPAAERPLQRCNCTAMRLTGYACDDHHRCLPMPATALRLLLALTLVFNGVTSAWAMVQPCHAATPANAVLEHPSPGARVTDVRTQHRSHELPGMTHSATHESMHQSMHPSVQSAHNAAHALKQDKSDPPGMQHRLCDGTCCKGMACPGHASVGAALQPTLPHTLKIAAARISPRLARHATRALPFAPPLRPPAN